MTGYNLLPIYLRREKYFLIKSFCFCKLNGKYDLDKTYVTLSGKKFNVNLKRVCGNLYYYKIKLPYEELTSLPIQNNFVFHFIGDEELEVTFKYNFIYRNFSIGNHSKIYNYEDMDLCAYIRQARKNVLALTVREKNYTDNHGFKIFLAWFLSLFSFNSKIILLYEKNNEKYEESASVVYEKLIDNGKKAYFILNENSKHWDNIKPKYRKNIIKSFTFKHYYYYFKCKKFIGSESISHAMEVRTINRFVSAKLYLKRFKYVFLQHGVMYMVSLDADGRHFFRKGGDMPINSKIVVSSKKEADHFVELGGFDYDDLIICGLPQYDKIIKNKNADKIIIMPTWRPWDYNQLESNYKKSTYYNFIKNILNNIPDNLKDKVEILPHPLIKEKLSNTNMSKYIPNVISYDKALEDASVLITDYSSIAYSAFYRGSNVIFCWEEKEECMKHYNAHLMLNDDNCFGDISYDYKDIKKLVLKNYNSKQENKYIKNYNKIVEFHDGNNTTRLYEYLEKNGFFK